MIRIAHRIAVALASYCRRPGQSTIVRRIAYRLERRIAARIILCAADVGASGQRWTLRDGSVVNGW